MNACTHHCVCYFNGNTGGIRRCCNCHALYTREEARQAIEDFVKENPDTNTPEISEKLKFKFGDVLAEVLFLQKEGKILIK